MMTLPVNRRSKPLPTSRRDPTVVSYNMSQIRSKGSLIEALLEKALRRQGLKPRKHYAVDGKPDFAFPRVRVAVFCDSHFWHGYRWALRKADLKNNRRFWIAKIERNIQRDKEVNRLLRREGWTIFRFWEHEIRDGADRCAAKVREYITSRRVAA
jgi:DNA mismatch endonuclease, patch repair protein